jgi:UDP-2-acetamido-3-amino-2,3-dideoxy-glucuronate N-acetyltransferase
MTEYFVHPSTFIDNPCAIGTGTKIWHYCHIMPGAIIGQNCRLGQNVMIGANVVIGNNVKIQNNVSIYEGVTLEDDVFCGPSCVFTNVLNPRSQIDRHLEYQSTLVRQGATIGANATIMCGINIGCYAFIGAGSLVLDDVPDYGLVLGVPGVLKGWMSRHGFRLPIPDKNGIMVCPGSGWRYHEKGPGLIRCIDWPETRALP